MGQKPGAGNPQDFGKQYLSIQGWGLGYPCQPVAHLLEYYGDGHGKLISKSDLQTCRLQSLYLKPYSSESGCFVTGCQFIDEFVDIPIDEHW